MSWFQAKFRNFFLNAEISYRNWHDLGIYFLNYVDFKVSPKDKKN